MVAQFYGSPEKYESLATSDAHENDYPEYVYNLDDSSSTIIYLSSYLN